MLRSDDDGIGQRGLYLSVFVGSLVLYTCYTAVYRLFFHPLAKYPGPWIAKLTNFYMVFHTVKGQPSFVRHDLHRKYGGVVRVGPDELSFSDLASIKDIYGQSSRPCLKAPVFYRGFTITGTESVFSTTDRAVHARMRRLLARGFSQQGVLQYQTEIDNIVARFISRVRESTAQPVEFQDLTQSLFFDIISQLGFGKSFNFLGGKTNQGAKDINTYFQICPVFGLAPFARYLPFGIFRAAYEAQPRIVQACNSWINDFRARLESGTTEGGLLRHMIEARDDETNTTFTDNELIENAVVFIIAGSETSATTVQYILYEMGKRPEMQTKLENEIRDAFPNKEISPDYNTAAELPYLNQVLQEVLRLRGPINTAPLRLSPGKTIAGDFIPQGTLISNIPYATHRDPVVFPDPEHFDPSRWENATADMNTMHNPFSTGTRNCIGMHLARVQILVTVCALYRNFDLTLDSSMNDNLMAIRDVGLMSPIGKTLKMHVKEHQ